MPADNPIPASAALWDKLVNAVQIEGIKVKKFSKFKEFREKMAPVLGIAPEAQLWYGWHRRKNETYRPKKLYSDRQDEDFVCHLRDEDDSMRHKTWSARLNLFYIVSIHPSQYIC